MHRETAYDEVFDAQRHFRTVLDAMSRPGRVNRLTGPVLSPPAPFLPASAAVAFALLNADVTFHLTGFTDAAAAYLTAHTHSRPAPAAQADFLFLSGDSSLVNSTRMAGLFPIAFAALIVAGLWEGARSSGTLSRVAVAGLVTAPLASVVSGAIEMNRIMFVIPFAVLVATSGAASLLRRGGLARAIGVLLIASVPIQFASFHRDYVNEYPSRAASWFGGNVRGAVRELLAGSGPSFMSGRIQFANRYWAFYSPDERRGELQIFQDDPPESPSGGRAVCQVTDASCAALQASPDWRQVSTVREINGEDTFKVFERR